MQDLPIFEHLRVMVIEEMIYLVHISGLADYVRSSLASEAQLLFVDLEHDPPKVLPDFLIHTFEPQHTHFYFPLW